MQNKKRKQAALEAQPKRWLDLDLGGREKEKRRRERGETGKGRSALADPPREMRCQGFFKDAQPVQVYESCYVHESVCILYGVLATSFDLLQAVLYSVPGRYKAQPNASRDIEEYVEDKAENE